MPALDTRYLISSAVITDFYSTAWSQRGNHNDTLPSATVRGSSVLTKLVRSYVTHLSYQLRPISSA